MNSDISHHHIPLSNGEQHRLSRSPQRNIPKVSHTNSNGPLWSGIVHTIRHALESDHGNQEHHLKTVVKSASGSQMSSTIPSSQPRLTMSERNGVDLFPPPRRWASRHHREPSAPSTSAPTPGTTPVPPAGRPPADPPLTIGPPTALSTLASGLLTTATSPHRLAHATIDASASINASPRTRRLLPPLPDRATISALQELVADLISTAPDPSVAAAFASVGYPMPDAINGPSKPAPTHFGINDGEAAPPTLRLAALPPDALASVADALGGGARAAQIIFARDAAVAAAVAASEVRAAAARGAAEASAARMRSRTAEREARGAAAMTAPGAMSTTARATGDSRPESVPVSAAAAAMGRKSAKVSPRDTASRASTELTAASRASTDFGDEWAWGRVLAVHRDSARASRRRGASVPGAPSSPPPDETVASAGAAATGAAVGVHRHVMEIATSSQGAPTWPYPPWEGRAVGADASTESVARRLLTSYDADTSADGDAQLTRERSASHMSVPAGAELRVAAQYNVRHHVGDLPPPAFPYVRRVVTPPQYAASSHARTLANNIRTPDDHSPTRTVNAFLVAPPPSRARQTPTHAPEHPLSVAPWGTSSSAAGATVPTPSLGGRVSIADHICVPPASPSPVLRGAAGASLTTSDGRAAMHAGDAGGHHRSLSPVVAGAPLPPHHVRLSPSRVSYVPSSSPLAPAAAAAAVASPAPLTPRTPLSAGHGTVATAPATATRAGGADAAADPSPLASSPPRHLRAGLVRAAGGDGPSMDVHPDSTDADVTDSTLPSAAVPSPGVAAVATPSTSALARSASSPSSPSSGLRGLHGSESIVVSGLETPASPEDVVPSSVTITHIPTADPASPRWRLRAGVDVSNVDPLASPTLTGPRSGPAGSPAGALTSPGYTTTTSPATAASVGGKGRQGYLVDATSPPRGGGGGGSVSGTNVSPLAALLSPQPPALRNQAPGAPGAAITTPASPCGAGSHSPAAASSTSPPADRADEPAAPADRRSFLAVPPAELAYRRAAAGVICALDDDALVEMVTFVRTLRAAWAPPFVGDGEEGSLDLLDASAWPSDIFVSFFNHLAACVATDGGDVPRLVLGPDGVACAVEDLAAATAASALRADSGPAADTVAPMAARGPASPTTAATSARPPPYPSPSAHRPSHSPVRLAAHYGLPSPTTDPLVSGPSTDTDIIYEHPTVLDVVEPGGSNWSLLHYLAGAVSGPVSPHAPAALPASTAGTAGPMPMNVTDPARCSSASPPRAVATRAQLRNASPARSPPPHLASPPAAGVHTVHAASQMGRIPSPTAAAGTPASNTPTAGTVVAPAATSMHHRPPSLLRDGDDDGTPSISPQPSPVEHVLRHHVIHPTAASTPASPPTHVTHGRSSVATAHGVVSGDTTSLQTTYRVEGFWAGTARSVGLASTASPYSPSTQRGAQLRRDGAAASSSGASPSSLPVVSSPPDVPAVLMHVAHVAFSPYAPPPAHHGLPSPPAVMHSPGTAPNPIDTGDSAHIRDAGDTATAHLAPAGYSISRTDGSRIRSSSYPYSPLLSPSAVDPSAATSAATAFVLRLPAGSPSRSMGGIGTRVGTPSFVSPSRRTVSSPPAAAAVEAAPPPPTPSPLGMISFSPAAAAAAATATAAATASSALSGGAMEMSATLRVCTQCRGARPLAEFPPRSATTADVPIATVCAHCAPLRVATPSAVMGDSYRAMSASSPSRLVDPATTTTTAITTGTTISTPIPRTTGATWLSPAPAPSVIRTVAPVHSPATSTTRDPSYIHIRARGADYVPAFTGVRPSSQSHSTVYVGGASATPPLSNRVVHVTPLSSAALRYAAERPPIAAASVIVMPTPSRIRAHSAPSSAHVSFAACDATGPVSPLSCTVSRRVPAVVPSRLTRSSSIPARATPTSVVYHRSPARTAHHAHHVPWHVSPAPVVMVMASDDDCDSCRALQATPHAVSHSILRSPSFDDGSPSPSPLAVGARPLPYATRSLSPSRSPYGRRAFSLEPVAVPLTTHVTLPSSRVLVHHHGAGADRGGSLLHTLSPRARSVSLSPRARGAAPPPWTSPTSIVPAPVPIYTSACMVTPSPPRPLDPTRYGASFMSPSSVVACLGTPDVSHLPRSISPSRHYVPTTVPSVLPLDPADPHAAPPAPRRDVLRRYPVPPSRENSASDVSFHVSTHPLSRATSHHTDTSIRTVPSEAVAVRRGLRPHSYDAPSDVASASLPPAENVENPLHDAPLSPGALSSEVPLVASAPTARASAVSAGWRGTFPSGHTPTVIHTTSVVRTGTAPSAVAVHRRPHDYYESSDAPGRGLPRVRSASAVVSRASDGASHWSTATSQQHTSSLLTGAPRVRSASTGAPLRVMDIASPASRATRVGSFLPPDQRHAAVWGPPLLGVHHRHNVSAAAGLTPLGVVPAGTVSQSDSVPQHHAPVAAFSDTRYRPANGGAVVRADLRGNGSGPAAHYSGAPSYDPSRTRTVPPPRSLWTDRTAADRSPFVAGPSTAFGAHAAVPSAPRGSGVPSGFTYSSPYPPPDAPIARSVLAPVGAGATESDSLWAKPPATDVRSTVLYAAPEAAPASAWMGEGRPRTAQYVGYPAAGQVVGTYASTVHSHHDSAASGSTASRGERWRGGALVTRSGLARVGSTAAAYSSARAAGGAHRDAPYAMSQPRGVAPFESVYNFPSRHASRPADLAGAMPPSAAVAAFAARGTGAAGAPTRGRSTAAIGAAQWDRARSMGPTTHRSDPAEPRTGARPTRSASYGGTDRRGERGMAKRPVYRM